MARNVRTAQAGETVLIEDKVQFVCPFCQKNASAGETDNVPYVLHEQPMCKLFEELEPDVYLRRVREFYQGN